MKTKNLEKYKELNSGGKYYEILGVDEKASYTEINEAFDKLSKKFYPNTSKENGAEEIHKIINTAYDMLSDPEKRRGYHIKRMKSNITGKWGILCALVAIVFAFVLLIGVSPSQLSVSMAPLMAMVFFGVIGYILGVSIGFARMGKEIKDVIIQAVFYAIGSFFVLAIVGIIMEIMLGVRFGYFPIIENVVDVIISITLLIIAGIIIGTLSGAIVGSIGWIIGKLINKLKGGAIDVNKEVAWLDSMPSPDTVDKKESEK